MLMLTAQNVTVLGGGVPEIYGGNMITELQCRLNARLGLTTQPVTPTLAPRPTTNTSAHSSTSTFVSTNANIDTNTSTDTRLAAELSDLNDIDMDELDYDGDMDQFDYDDDMDDDMDESNQINTGPPSVNQNIPNAPTNNDSDDDFVTTQPSPVRTRLIHKAPISLSKRTKVNLPEEIIPVKKEKKPVADTVHWVDPSTWLNDDDEIEGVEVRADGKTYVTFDALHRIIGQMEQNTFTGSLADTVTVQAKYIKMSAMRLSEASGFYSIFDIGDPSGMNKGAVRTVIGNKVKYTCDIM